MQDLSKLNWDYAHAHILKFQVSKENIDVLGHANNKVYLDWCEVVSWDHSKTLGVSFDDYNELRCACVVLKNNMDYLGSLFEGDKVAISTWITHTDSKLRISRLFQVIHIKDNKTVFRSKVNYVCVNLDTFKPMKMPDLLKQAYKITI